MPELPEVETTCRGIEPFAVNQSISKVIIRQPKLRWQVPSKLPNMLKDQKIISIKRRAKYILIETTNGTVIIHLGMSGRFCVQSKDKLAEKHDHVDFVLSNAKILRYTDPRRFGCVQWVKDDPLQHKLLIDLGPEPLENSFNANYLYNKSLTKKLCVKQFIMDAKVVVGVGNIYASEALFAAKIHPKQNANKISLNQYKILVIEIKKILKKSIRQGGTTLRDFLHSDGKPGYFSQTLMVYGRANDPCMVCNTPISQERLGQRNTFFCENCQS
jgi:formamidopyrimidine-DNA glycosylase